MSDEAVVGRDDEGVVDWDEAGAEEGAERVALVEEGLSVEEVAAFEEEAGRAEVDAEEELEPPDDAMESLDEILRRQFEGEGSEEPGGPEAAGGSVGGGAEAADRRLGVLELEPPVPRGADEFVCRSCFLVKRRCQLADPVRGLCRDCVGAP